MDELYQQKAYRFSNGFNSSHHRFIDGILPNVPGFLLKMKLVSADAFPGWITNLYHYAWFVGFFVSGIVYWLLMRKLRIKVMSLKSQRKLIILNSKL